MRQCTTAAPAAPVRATPQVPAHASKYVGAWLLGCSGMVFGAVVLGKHNLVLNAKSFH